MMKTATVTAAEETDPWDFIDLLIVAASGMRAQSDRMRVIAENIANANSTRPRRAAIPTAADRDGSAANSTRAERDAVTPGQASGRTFANSACNTIPAYPTPTPRATSSCPT